MKYKSEAPIKDLIYVVTESFNIAIPDRLTNGFITLQAIMREVLLRNGDNTYNVLRLKNELDNVRRSQLLLFHVIPKRYCKQMTS